MTRKRIEVQLKPCIVCGKTIQRVPGMSPFDYYRRNCCSRRCAKSRQYYAAALAIVVEPPPLELPDELPVQPRNDWLHCSVEIFLRYLAEWESGECPRPQEGGHGKLAVDIDSDDRSGLSVG